MDILEKLRRTAVGEARRDYLASVIHTYQFLVSAHVLNGSPAKAFAVMELSRAKLLAERLGLAGKSPQPPLQGGAKADPSGTLATLQGGAKAGPSGTLATLQGGSNLTLEAAQKGLSGNMVMLAYANSDGEKLVQLAITPQSVAGREIAVKSVISPALQKFDAELKASQEKQRGIKVVKSPRPHQIPPTPFFKGGVEHGGAKADPSGTLAPLHGGAKAKNDLENLVNYYRLLLSEPAAEPGNEAKRREVARALYDLLIAPAAAELQGKTSGGGPSALLIIPDGILNYVPFETLIDPEGRYLVEKFDIAYAPSAQALGMLRERKYPAERKPLLAFGGGVYDPKSYAVDTDGPLPMVKTAAQLAYLEKRVLGTIAARGLVGQTYAELGAGQWDNLPGTLAEVEEIGGIVKGSDIFTGRQVTEGRVKAMSASGELARYKVVHLATHELAVPEIPELSAVVLSQLQEGEKGEDGYLRMGEIAQLKLNADFVNLSACQTGIGRIYGGEGVVGLAQAFLLAGANSVSVSLWSVADDSTKQFMVGVYRLVNETGMSYSQAVNAMKRAFIRGKVAGGMLEAERGIKVVAKAGASGQYSHPYHWAPFVYYGALKN